MLLKVGQLAKRSGLTVRTLHHYDSIGLLTPSARTDAGYRLYNKADITTLHQIQALRRMGLDLAGIGALLARTDLPFAAIVERQIDMLERQIAQASLLRGRLQKLQQQLSAGDEPELADLLTTLELMTMYDKYFTPDELKQLPLYQADNAAITAEWAALVADVAAMMANETSAQDPAAQALATRWMSMVGRDTNHDARLFTKLNHMHEQEPALQSQTGITPEVMAFVLRASAEARYVAFANYLNDDEMAFLKANFTRRGREWPGLFAEVRQQMELGAAADAPAMQALAARWAELFASYAGTDPATHAKIHAAQRNEPALRAGSFVTPQMVDYVKQAMALLPKP